MALEPSVLEEFQREYQEINDLVDTDEDATPTPYKSKYLAIEKLESLINQLDEASEDQRAIKVNLVVKLAHVFHLVEELNKAQAHLESIESLTDNNESPGKFLIPTLVGLNQLGILWSARNDIEKARTTLERSLVVHKEYRQHPYEAQSIEDLLELEKTVLNAKVVETLHTHTMFYMAQVLERSGEKDRAAMFCHLTLRKQLELDSFEPLDWARNSYTLSHYFLVNDLYDMARHHIAASWTVLENFRAKLADQNEEEGAGTEDQEALEREIANLHLAWGRYAYVLLSKSHDTFIGNPSEPHELAEVPNVEEEPDFFFHAFATLKVDPMFEDIPTKLASNFEEARAIFLPAQRHLNSAKLFFTFENHCVDFIEINQNLSVMTKLLANFEPDLDRKFKIHKRRIELLATPLKELSQHHYLALCRKLTFELAETYESMMDAKLDWMKSSEENYTPKNIQKVNTIIEQSIGHFTKYIESFKKTNGEFPDRLQSDDVRPVLMAYFHLGRLWDKLIVPEVSEVKLKNKIEMYNSFNSFVSYCDSHPETEDLVKGELLAVREMVSLLPLRIQKLKAEVEAAKK